MRSSPTKTKVPSVVIVGRPNVGKSSLFNRLIGRRRAITDPIPGVTRDPLEEVCSIGGRRVRLIDTGGLRYEAEGIEELAARRSRELVEEADIVVLLVSVEGLTGEDEEIIEKLRPYEDKLILAVNKVDNEKRENLVWDFLSTGLTDPVAVSAAHGRNIDDLEERIREKIDLISEDEKEESEPEDEGIRLAILGKPNTGKSTLVNALTDSSLSIVSDIPGTTRDSIEGSFSYKGKPFWIVDTAGIRRKNRVETDLEYFSVNRAIATIAEADVVFLLIDAEEGLTDQDKKIASLIVKRGIGIILVLNKWDKLPKIENRFQAVSDRIRYLFPILSFSPLLAISALKKEGIDKLLNTAVKVNNQLAKRIDTGKLNQSLRTWVEKHPPPTSKKGNFRLKYMTQVSVKPLRFLLFVNRLQSFPRSYLRYIENRIRKEFDFDQAPLEIQLRLSGKR